MTDEEVVAPTRRGSAGRVRRLLARGQFGLGARTWQALVAITAIALLARLVGLGYRPMHFDEARVAYWALRYAETGHFEYRYIIHGPLLQHVDRWLFALVGANDYVARLPVALVGGLLPLAAVLYRDHLRESELVGLAALLSVSPILLYYSRFMRSDVLVAAAMFVALGALVRLHATGRPRYLHAATLAVALGFASKENAVVYLVAWLGAAALVVDTGLYRPRSGQGGLARVVSGTRRLVGDRGRARSLAVRWGGHGLATLFLFGLATLVLFAPRAGSAGGVGLWKTLTRPTMVPALLTETGRDIAYGLGYWFGGSTEARCFKEALLPGYVCFLQRYLETMVRFAAPLSALAAAGFLYERYVAARSRNLVVFAGYWGVASVVGYPLGMDIWASWPVIHALVPLSIPAAVAFGAVLRRGGSALAARRRADSGPESGSASGLLDRNLLDGATAALLLVLLVGYSGAVAAEQSFAEPRDRDGQVDMVQYAQPASDMRPGLRTMRAAVADNEGLDVLYYGDSYYLADEGDVALPPSQLDGVERVPGPWFDRLPLPWYTQAFDATVASATNESGLDRGLDREPAVLIVEANEADAVAERTDAYRRYDQYDLRAHVDGPSRVTSVVVFFREP
jgi:uncharacterized protein (TIGR03663 family)